MKRSILYSFSFILLLLTLGIIPVYAQTLSMSNKVVKPSAKITVNFTAPSSYASNAWIGIIPSHIIHGSEVMNDRNDITYQYLDNRTNGTLTFTAPSEVGSYDFRMNDNDNSGKEVASVSFMVSNKSSINNNNKIKNTSLNTEKTLFNNWNKAVAYNMQKAAPQFRLESPRTITRIINYHWNDGRGKVPGTIALVDQYGNVYGPWNCEGTTGTGVSNANWECWPNIKLPIGIYTVIDSDPSTCSQNQQSGGVGFSQVMGY